MRLRQGREVTHVDGRLSLALYSRAMRRYAVVLFLLVVSPFLRAQDMADTPANDGQRKGYVTAITSPTVFDVDAEHVAATPETTYVGEKHTLTAAEVAAGPLALGDYVEVTGNQTMTVGQPNVFRDTKIVIQESSVKQISSAAVVDRVVAGSTQQTVRADGYTIVLPAKTVYAPPLKEGSVPAAGMWLVYGGWRRKDGSVLADHAMLSANIPSDSEKKFDAKELGKFTAPDYDRKKAGEVKLFPSVKGKLPLDKAAQDRVQRIGDRLVPAYQKALAAKDPAKIDFHFYVMDDKSLHSDASAPNGLVLIPTQMLDRLQNDDQVAAVLADGIATALEREYYVTRKGRDTAASVVVVSATVVGGPVGMIGGMIAGARILRKMREQSGRESLSLMQDAGYDVMQAPEAWRLMAPKKAKDTSSTAIPSRSAYLLGIIAMEYRKTPPVSAQVSSAAVR